MNLPQQELAYWLALAHLPTMRTARKNSLIAAMVDKQQSIVDFFHCDDHTLLARYKITATELALLQTARSQLPNYAFLVEDLLDQGYEIIPLTSPAYSPILKNNLKMSHCPPLIYCKGNLQILQEDSVAIVGSRKASQQALAFTDAVARRASQNYKVVVSGFAKGIDKQALESSLKYKGQSVIVLPQGIATFQSGFKKYYRQIVDGDVLVLSSFHPRAAWQVGLAMARNAYIYGLAHTIYVAESSSSGGTWSGVLDGLRRGRSIYVRAPDPAEKNANNLLIAQGATAVDMEGNALAHYETAASGLLLQDATVDWQDLEARIRNLLQRGAYTSREIMAQLELDWSTDKMTHYLKSLKGLESQKMGSALVFGIALPKAEQGSLF